MASERLKLIERSEDYEVLKVWQREHRESLKLDNAGFAGDSDVPLLGLEEQEDELLLSQVKDYNFAAERHRYRGIPLSMCTPEEARRARAADIDDMDHPAWDSES